MSRPAKLFSLVLALLLAIPAFAQQSTVATSNDKELRRSIIGGKKARCRAPARAVPAPDQGRATTQLSRSGSRINRPRRRAQSPGWGRASGEAGATHDPAHTRVGRGGGGGPAEALSRRFRAC